MDIKIHNLTGQKFGRLSVIREAGRAKNRNVYWLCRCDCGKKKTIVSSSLLTNHTKSCGCLKKEKFINLIGQRFGKLIVLKRVKKNKSINLLWLCVCSCGKRTIVMSKNLRKGNTKSCGCSHFKHGYNEKGKRSGTYGSWCGMKSRCNNKNNPSFKNYGGRNRPITVCKRWSNKKNGFINFLKDMGKRPENKTLDRINNNLGYFKKNCRWATKIQQARNTRKNIKISINEKKYLLVEVAEKYGLKPETVLYRLNRNISLLIPTRKSKREIK